MEKLEKSRKIIEEQIEKLQSIQRSMKVDSSEELYNFILIARTIVEITSELKMHQTIDYRCYIED